MLLLGALYRRVRILRPALAALLPAASLTGTASCAASTTADLSTVPGPTLLPAPTLTGRKARRARVIRRVVAGAFLGDLAASPVCTCAATAILTTGIALAGAASVSATTTGALASGLPMDVAVSCTATTAGALSTSIALAGTCTATVTLAAQLTVPTPLPRRTLWRTRSLGGIVAAHAAARSRRLMAPGPQLVRGMMTEPLFTTLQGAAACAATSAAALTTAKPLQGQASAVCTVSAALTTALQFVPAPALCVCTAVGQLTSRLPLAGAATGVVTATAALTTAPGEMAGIALCTADATANLNLAVPIAGQATCTLVAAGQLTTAVPVVGQARCQVTVTAALTVTAPATLRPIEGRILVEPRYHVEILLQGGPMTDGIAEVALDNDLPYRFRLKERDDRDRLIPAAGLTGVQGYLSTAADGTGAIADTTVPVAERARAPGVYAGILDATRVNTALAAYVGQVIYLICEQAGNLEVYEPVRVVAARRAD